MARCRAADKLRTLSVRHGHAPRLPNRLARIEREVICNIEDGVSTPSAGVHIRKLCENAELDFRDAVRQDRIEVGRERQRWEAELAKIRARTIGPTDLIYLTRPPRKVR
jgi:hypothetical protein